MLQTNGAQHVQDRPDGGKYSRRVDVFELLGQLEAGFGGAGLNVAPRCSAQQLECVLRERLLGCFVLLEVKVGVQFCRTVCSVWKGRKKNRMYLNNE